MEDRLALIQLALLALPPREAVRRASELCEGSWSSAIRELADELALLRREVGEWACPACPIILPRGPAPGEAAPPCPRCGRPTVPRGEKERNELRAKMELLARQVVQVQGERRREADRVRRALETFLGPGWRLIRGGDMDETISWALDQGSSSFSFSSSGGASDSSFSSSGGGGTLGVEPQRIESKLRP